jgi:ATP-dependent RNA helicase RhlE
VLVFTRTKLAASRLAAWLDRRGVGAVAIHSDRSQPERTRALDAFKNGDVQVLVATDVAARGLDIEDLPHVVNFELPWQAQDYVHRIGRTGRAGASGEAISLVSIDEADLLRGVQRLLGRAIPWTVEEGFVPDRTVKPRPLRGGGFGRDVTSGGYGRNGESARATTAGPPRRRTGATARRPPSPPRPG